MTQYVDKSAVVAYIEKERKEYATAFSNMDFKSYEAGLIAKGKYRMLQDILSFINTLEVKEVDLEKEIEVYFNNWVDDVPEDTNPNGIEMPNGKYAHLSELNQIARHFFELGIKTKGEKL